MCDARFTGGRPDLPPQPKNRCGAPRLGLRVRSWGRLHIGRGVFQGQVLDLEKAVTKSPDSWTMLDPSVSEAHPEEDEDS